MGFGIFLQSVTEPVQAALFCGSLIAVGFAIGFWAGRQRWKVFHVQTGHFNVMPGASINTTSPLKPKR